MPFSCQFYADETHKNFLKGRSSSNEFGQLVDKVEKLLTVCQHIITSGPLPEKLPTKINFRKILLNQKNRL